MMKKKSDKLANGWSPDISFENVYIFILSTKTEEGIVYPTYITSVSYKVHCFATQINNL